MGRPHIFRGPPLLLVLFEIVCFLGEDIVFLFNGAPVVASQTTRGLRTTGWEPLHWSIWLSSPPNTHHAMLTEISEFLPDLSPNKTSALVSRLLQNETNIKQRELATE